MDGKMLAMLGFKKTGFVSAFNRASSLLSSLFVNISHG